MLHLDTETSQQRTTVENDFFDLLYGQYINSGETIGDPFFVTWTEGPSPNFRKLPTKKKDSMRPLDHNQVVSKNCKKAP